MRIGIDYTAAVRQGGGIGRYTRNLIRALAELDRENRYTLFVAGGYGAGDGRGPWPENFRVRSLPLSDRWLNILWQRLRLPLPVQVVTGPLDLFHSPDFVLPPTGRTPAILTVHDLSFLRFPQFFVPGFRAYLEGAVSRAVKRARHILADSESTRRDLVELLSVEAERVSVLYPGVEPRFRPVADAGELARVRARYALPEHFILGLGTLQPRKNFEGLIDAFARLQRDIIHDRPGSHAWQSGGVACPATLRLWRVPDRHRGAASAEMGRDLHLVVAGGRGWMYEDLLALPERLGLGDRVRFLGFVADADLPALYTLAAVLAFPSWYEGFGLPLLEAMACGTPVVAADNSSLPEAAGDAALLVDAGDSGALAGALHRLLTDGALRARLIPAGQEQARRFTWESSARQLLGLYRFPPNGDFSRVS